MADEPLWRRYRRLLRADPERDVDDEIAFHMKMRIEEYGRAGLSPVEAREETVRRFGNVNRVVEECHELGRQRAARRRRTWVWQTLRDDLRVALRGIAARRGFALAVILTMALGIGANTAVFSVAYGVLLRPLPYHDANAVVRLWTKNVPRSLLYFSVSPADYTVWRAENRVFGAMAAFERQRDATVRRTGEPISIEVARVTPDMFPLLGAGVSLGRAMVGDDARPGAPPVALLSDEVWRTRFGADSAIVGNALTIDGQPYSVIGVMPPRFLVPGTPAQIWLPLSLADATDDHGNRYLRVLGRLRSGTTIATAQTELDVIAARLAREFPGTNDDWSVNMMPIIENMIGEQFQRAVLVLVGVVGFVLLIACANAANLQLARAASRRREIAVRVALGATRRRILSQLLTESVVLALIAGAAGLALAYAGISLLRVLGTRVVPRLDDVQLDAPALAFTVAIALGTSILFGLVPALRASRPDVGDVLKDGGRSGDSASGGRTIRSTLVVAEVMLSLVLLVGAALLLRSFARLQAVDVGFQSEGILVVPNRLPEGAYPKPEQIAAHFDAALDRVRRLPGVTAAAAINSAPFAGPNSSVSFTRVDRPVPEGAIPDADYRVVTPGLLETLRIAVHRGRDFATSDRPTTERVTIISETMARRYWPNEDPTGTRIRLANATTGPMFTIIGVADDVRYQSLETPELRPMMYFSALQSPQRTMSIVVRSPDPAAIARSVRTAVGSIDPALPAPTPTPLDELVGYATASRRFALVLLGVFATIAMVLAAVGIYGVMAYSVRQQTHELGIRIALGAQASKLVAGVVGRAARLAITGVALGLAGSWWLTKWLSTLLFDIEATDPLTFGVVAALLTFIAIVASLVPAYAATRADPMAALRGNEGR
jgi:putative ABC transport system permease protein